MHDLLVYALIENEPLSTEHLRGDVISIDNAIEELAALADMPDGRMRRAVRVVAFDRATSMQVCASTAETLIRLRRKRRSLAARQVGEANTARRLDDEVRRHADAAAEAARNPDV